MKKSKLLCLLLLQIIVLSCKNSDNKNIIVTKDKDVSIEKKISDNKLKDTLVISDNNTIIFFEPNTIEIEQLKKKHGKEDFYTIADDVSGYLANITEQLDLKKIKYITTDSKVVSFKSLGLFVNKDDLESKWSILYLDKDKTIKKVTPIDFDINDIATK